MVLWRATLGIFSVFGFLTVPLGAQSAQVGKMASVKAGGGMGDGLTAQRVRHQMVIDRRFDASGVQVVSSSGRVALNGKVSTREARAFAEADARKVSAVHFVINRLRIEP